MTAEIFNTAQLRTHISDQIRDFQHDLSTKHIPEEKLISLIDSLLNERSLLLDELDRLKQKISSIESQFIPRHHDSVLTLSEIEENTYNDFQNLTRKLQKSEGELLSKLMQFFLLPKSDDSSPQISSSDLRTIFNGITPTVQISDHNHLVITDNDLHEIQEKVDFKRIKLLELDVNIETFSNLINSISHCSVVKVSLDIPKLLVFSKISDYEEIHFIPSVSGPCIEYAKSANQLVEDWSKKD